MRFWMYEAMMRKMVIVQAMKRFPVLGAVRKMLPNGRALKKGDLRSLLNALAVIHPDLKKGRFGQEGGIC